MANMFEVIQICDERMTDIIENHRGLLDAFVEDDTNDNHAMVKIYITLAIAQSFAVKAVNNGDGNEDAEIL